jgi:integrase
VTFSLLRQMFAFAVGRDIVESDPTSGIKKSAIGGANVERDRFLDEGEIRLLKTRLEKSDVAESSQMALWAMLATCCRIGELTQARWEHIDMESRVWRIPADVAKNGKEFRVFLSDFALRQFEGLRRLAGESDWVMPARNRSPRGHVCPKSLTKQVADRQRGDQAAMSKRSPLTSSLILPGGKWTPHDLRRTGATLMVSLRVIPEVADRCLNHSEQNRVKRTYQRHSYEPEMREAWRMLGERIELLTSEATNVITLKTA